MTIFYLLQKENLNFLCSIWVDRSESMLISTSWEKKSPISTDLWPEYYKIFDYQFILQT